MKHYHKVISPTKNETEYFIVYKPYGVLSQFTPEKSGDLTLAHLYEFPTDVYPIGRLDKDSEGLLILTNDKSLNSIILNPAQKTLKVYHVLVEGIPTPDFILNMVSGVEINAEGKIHTGKAKEVKILKLPPDLPERVPPVRTRKTITDSWISVTLEEGKNRQIRKMCAKLGYPVLRIVRIQVGKCRLDRMRPGDVVQVSKSAII
jgi:23S rRNA pseudouridine2457 synthase